MKKSTSVILALLISIGTLVFAFFAVRFFVDWIGSLKSNTQPAVIAAIGLVVVAFITYFANRTAERRRVVEELTRKEKIELYMEFVSFLMRLVMNAPKVTKPTEDETLDFFASITPRLIVYGSNSVIKRWGKLRINLEGSQDGVAVMFNYEGLLKAMRKDVGHGSFTIQDGDILRLFVNDVDEEMAKLKQKARVKPKP
jgi:hypothetical protein